MPTKNPGTIATRIEQAADGHDDAARTTASSAPTAAVTRTRASPREVHRQPAQEGRALHVAGEHQQRQRDAGRDLEPPHLRTWSSSRPNSVIVTLPAPVTPCRLHDEHQRRRQDPGVQQEGASVDVLDVQAEPLVPLDLVAPADLGQPGDAGPDLVPARLLGGVAIEVLDERAAAARPGSCRRARRSTGWAARPGSCCAARRRTASAARASVTSERLGSGSSIERNFTSSKTAPSFPGRGWRKSTGEPRRRRTSDGDERLDRCREHQEQAGDEDVDRPLDGVVATTTHESPPAWPAPRRPARTAPRSSPSRTAA